MEKTFTLAELMTYPARRLGQALACKLGEPPPYFRTTVQFGPTVTNVPRENENVLGATPVVSIVVKDDRKTLAEMQVHWDPDFAARNDVTVAAARKAAIRAVQVDMVASPTWRLPGATPA